MGWSDVVELFQRRVEDVPELRSVGDRKSAEAFKSYFEARKLYHDSLERLHSTPLMIAWRHTIFDDPKEDASHMKLTQALLDFGRCRKFHDGKTPLMKAVKAGSLEIMEFLLRFNSKDFVIHDAAEVTCSNMTELAHININEQNVRGYTALMYCMKYATKMDKLAAQDPIQIQKVTQMTSMLLVEQSHNVKIDINGPLKNERGQTALDIAKSIKHRTLRKTLVNTLMEKL